MIDKEKTLIVCALEQETNNELQEYNVLYTGVGKINATFSLVNYFNRITNGPWVSPKEAKQGLPEIVINFGTAGSKNIPIGKLIECTSFIQRDMDARGLGFDEFETPFCKDIPIILSNGKGFTCGTGDNFVENTKNESKLIDVFDMEAYALANVCNRYNVPFISYKYITDNANESSSKDWLEHIADGIIEFKNTILCKK